MTKNFEELLEDVKSAEGVSDWSVSDICLVQIAIAVSDISLYLADIKKSIARMERLGRR